MLGLLQNFVEHSRSASTLVPEQIAPRFKDELGQLNDPERFSFPPIPFVDGEPVFRMFVLGTRGAGKTVFLASLYNQLKIQDDGRNNYSVVVESGEHRGFLIDTYDQIVNTNADWPIGTADITDFEFQCIYSSKESELPIFRFHYVDFPGGFVTRTKIGDNEFNIMSAVKEAHTVLVLIDGKKVLNELEGVDDGGPSIHKDLSDVLDVVQRCIRRPLQFVLTKHDLLSKYSLAEIRDVLLANEHFVRIITQRKKLGMPTYLIPVSAVGTRFAEWDRASGAMKKKRNGRPEPYNVDLTLCYAITDALLTRFKQQQAPGDATKGALASMVVRVLRFLSKAGKYGAFIADDMFILRAAAVLEAISRCVEKKVGAIADEIDAKLGKIRDKNSA